MAKHPKGYNVEGDASSGLKTTNAPTVSDAAKSDGRAFGKATSTTAKKKRKKTPKQLVQEFIKTGRRSA